MANQVKADSQITVGGKDSTTTAPSTSRRGETGRMSQPSDYRDNDHPGYSSQGHEGGYGASRYEGENTMWGAEHMEAREKPDAQRMEPMKTPPLPHRFEFQDQELDHQSTYGSGQGKVVKKDQ